MNAPTRSIGEILGGLPAAKTRRTGQPVWRNSYYEGQIEIHIWKPFAGGNVRAAKRRIGAILKSAREYDKRTRRARQLRQSGARNGMIGHIGLAVLEALYTRYLDFRTGRMEPAIATLADAVGHSYAAVHAALRRLREAGFLHWVRRSRPIEDAAGAGPRVEQITNAYVPLLPPVIERAVAHLLGKAPLPDDTRWHRDQQAKEWQRLLDTMSSSEMLQATWTGDALLGETLARLAAALDQKRESRSSVETGGI